MNKSDLNPARCITTGMKAVILAGGKGTRLEPFTANLPKPLVPLDGVPILEVLIRRLIHYGITDITLTLGHLAELIQAYFEQRHGWMEKININFVEDNEPTGTAGSLSFIPDLAKTFLVINGDLLTNLNFNDLVQFHQNHKAALTIAYHTQTVKIDLGVLKLNDQQQVIDYIEKPETSYSVSMGIYVYEPHILKYIDYGEYLDFPDLVSRLIKEGEQICAYPANCLWLDIGRPDDYEKAQNLFSEKREEFDLV